MQGALLWDEENAFLITGRVKKPYNTFSENKHVLVSVSNSCDL